MLLLWFMFTCSSTISFKLTFFSFSHLIFLILKIISAVPPFSIIQTFLGEHEGSQVLLYLRQLPCWFLSSLTTEADDTTCGSWAHIISTSFHRQNGHLLHVLQKEAWTSPPPGSLLSFPIPHTVLAGNSEIFPESSIVPRPYGNFHKSRVMPVLFGTL